MKNFPFHYAKAAQAVASLLRLEHPHRMNYYRLLKLLYIADRESIKEVGRPIIGGRMIAMKRGPLHSTVLDIIKGMDRHSPDWAKCFCVDRWDIRMIHDPGNSELSGNELELLGRVIRQFKEDDEWAVGDHTHAFAEFIDNKPKSADGPQSTTIPLEDVIRAVGRSTDEDAILRDAQEVTVFDRVFGR